MPLIKSVRQIPKERRILLYLFLIALFLLVLWQRPWLERSNFAALPDFSAIEDVTEMKQAFYSYLTPIIEHHNESIQQQRARLLVLQKKRADGRSLSMLDRRWLRKLSVQYELEWGAAEAQDALLEKLLLRVDTIPLDLALVQAAKESAWGRSRFAVEANNLFGQWCYIEGCGIVPNNRPAGAHHEVEAFSSVSEAIRRYMNNLNTHPSYAGFRHLRLALREAEKPLAGMALAKTLSFYSERRSEYVDDIRSMIAQYQRLQSEQGGSS
ncbi:glucosaminidase domain-containing protein [Parahaliea sp. F7430]|uniref:Glucosaminidase domain-containing protein n=1 Tax=Sediminihaliea albiluteola TaxID=2758564 RepID=A0A7W2TTL9_9GAMM|nr:glucosaminidase domain-containing protein [Sediminihaliea albiluteola]MBA6411722.1 glucosaminidase domain-containing protein [Sediminihaliea albiluteola]